MVPTPNAAQLSPALPAMPTEHWEVQTREHLWSQVTGTTEDRAATLKWLPFPFLLPDLTS
jgi:hypothetical protein